MKGEDKAFLSNNYLHNDSSFVVDLPAAETETMNLSAIGSTSEGEDEAILSNNYSHNDIDDSFIVDLPAAGTEYMNLDEIILVNGSPGDW